MTLALAPLGCGGSGDQAKARELCHQQLALMCHNTFTCPGVAERQTTYTSEEDCNAKTSPSCDGPTTCLSGKYHLDKDQQCLVEMQAVTCAQVLDGSGFPSVCLEVCTAG